MSVRNLARCALFVAAMTVCAWLAFPVPPVPFTLQSFALFLALLLMGGKYGSLVCAVYLLLGIAGAPVFSGFRGGIGAILGPTGGFLTGFLVCSLFYWLMSHLLGNRIKLPALILGWVLCYATGTAWLLIYYPGDSLSVWTALWQYVVPFILPDGIKLALALLLSKKLRTIV